MAIPSSECKTARRVLLFTASFDLQHAGVRRPARIKVGLRLTREPELWHEAPSLGPWSKGSYVSQRGSGACLNEVRQLAVLFKCSAL